MNFEWDENKENANIAKHGVSFGEAKVAFYDEDRIIYEDAVHSLDEPRHFCIGKTEPGILTVRFTVRGEAIRIIGAGYWRKGKAIYEQEKERR